MKIFINARFLSQPVSGVQRYGIECSRTIKRKYPEAVFLCPPDIFNKQAAEELGATVIGTRKGHLWEQVDLPAYLRKQGNPPLFNPCNTAPFLYNNNFITLHDLAFHHHPEWNSKLFSLWYNFLVPRITHKSKHVFTVSNTMKAEISECYNIPLPKISVTYNGVSEKMMAMKVPGILTKEKFILSVGSFNARKNHHLLIKAFMASDIKDSYKLVIIGDKSKVFSETGIDDAELVKNNIQVMRQLPEDELIKMYQRAEMVVSLSAYEGFGIPLLEGLYNGCNVVCSDIAVYRELYNDHAVFCNPGDRNSIIEAIKKAALSKQEGSVDELFTKYNYASSAQVILDRMLQG